MITDKQIQILLSTYNGEKYLRQQLDSYVALEGFEQIKVLIRDDGSTDGTKDILKEYQEKYGFEIILGQNIGVTRSFFELLCCSDKVCKFFALSDQDDVWIAEKFTRALKILSPMPQDIPLMYASLSEVVREDLTLMGTTLNPVKDVGFYNAMVQNIAPGHTQVYNRELVDLLIENCFDEVAVVDWWIYLVAGAVGRVVFDRHCTVKHRQHGENAVGYQLGTFKRIMTRIKKLNRHDGNTISRQLKSFYNIYGEMLTEEHRVELENYLSSLNTMKSRIAYAVNCKVYRQTKFETILFKSLYILGKYNLMTQP